MSDTTSTPSLDIDSLMSHIGADVALLAELVELFEEYYPIHIASVREAVDSGDAPALREAAHQLKGAISNFYAGTAVSIAQKLENAGRDGSLENAEADLKQLEVSIDLVRSELQSLCKSDS